MWEDFTQISPAQERTVSKTSLDPRQRIISVIVAAGSDKAAIVTTLKSALSQLFVREVIVVNSEGSPDIEALLTQYANAHPRCFVINGHSGMGLAAAYNLGAQYASCPYFLFLSSTCILPKYATLKLLTTGIRKASPWVVGAKALSQGIDIPREERFSSSLVTKFGLFEFKENQQAAEVSLPGGGIHTLMITPECMLLPSKAFSQLKGMDENCFHTTFHFDLCLRTHLAGGGVYSVKGLDYLRGSDELPPKTLTKVFRQQWQAMRGWQHLYSKHASFNTNKFLIVFLTLILGVRLLGTMSYQIFSGLLPSRKLGKAKRAHVT